MNEWNEEKEAIEAELRCLHSSLDASSSVYGDWNMCKYFESFLNIMKEATKDEFIDKFMEWISFTSEKLQDVIQQREATRERINELEEQLKNMS